MNKLEDVARQVLERERARGCLAETTMDSLKRYVNQMLALAESAGFAEPCQDLYDAFAADDRGSTERRSMHVHVNKLVDAVAGTRAVNPGGMFYNEPDMPTAEEVEAAFGKAGLAGEGAGVLVVVARADAEMARFGLTQSTMGQYRHAWRELAAYLQVKNGSLLYDEAGIRAFADEARKDPRLPEWRRKIRRKASAVLVEVALTGTCEWRLEREGPRAPTEELEVLRADYIGFLRARNLAATTIGLQDWGLRRMLEFSGATTLDDVASFGADQVAAMVGGFSGICTTRSLSTALPVVRRALDYLGEAGFCRAGLSGLVMTPYSQRGGEVTFLPVDDEVRLVQSLQEESARDRAMMLLALRLGLRDSDIRSLRFDEVDWVHDRICLSQQKTGVPLTLPPVPEVGNAIMEYITGERPSSAAGYPYVFVREQAPHVKLTSLYTVCSKALRRSGAVSEEEGPAGMHLLRRTLARRMLETSVTHAVLGDALGHSNPDRASPTYPSTRACWRHAPSTCPESASRHGAEEVAAVRDENYESKLSADIAAFVAQKRACGYPYVESATILRRFDRMVAERFPDDETVTKGACDAWLSLVADEHPNELMRRVSPVRQLAKYMAAAGKPSYVIPPGIPGKRLKYQAHIFTREELSAFFAAIDSCGPSACSPTKAYVVPTLFRMLYCCGMRSSEALLLGASGVDLEAGRIDVKGCKGWRGRTVYMGDDMLRVCRAYDAVIEGMLPGRVPFFPNREGGFFSRSAPNRWFHQFWDPLPEAARVKGNPPRVHDFRHTHAVTRLNRWVEEGADVEAMYPYLSGFLGHANFADTSYYLKMSASFYPELDRRMAPVNSLVLPEVVRHGAEG